jgi:hypothetical protein
MVKKIFPIPGLIERIILQAVHHFIHFLEKLNTQAFTLEQRQALSYMSILSDEQGFSVGLIFFGFGSLLLCYLVYKSGYLPRFIGILMAIAGTCYLVNSFTLILAPDLASRLFPAILLPSFIAELILCFRLLLKGVDVEQWQQLHTNSKSARVPEK